MSEESSRPIIAPHRADLDLASGFRAPFVRRPLPPLYLPGIIICAIIALLIPLAYLGLIGVITHQSLALLRPRETPTAAVSTPAEPPRGRMLPPSRPPLGRMTLGILGLIFALLMFKALLAPRQRSRTTVQVSPAEESELYAFIDRACAHMGVPAPAQVYFIAEPNAFAAVEGGLLGALVGRRPVLGIGLPLVAGMNLNQFCAVLAHELGHVDQGIAGRATAIIESVKDLMLVGAFRLDAVDLFFLRAMANDRSSAWIGLPLLILSIPARLLLLALGLIAGFPALLMARQMEHDADRAGHAFAGSDAYATMIRRMEELSAGTSQAIEEIRDFARKQELPDDVASLIAGAADRLGSEAKVQIEEDLKNRSAAFWAVHPATGERLVRARKAEEPGCFKLDVPATVLFRDFRSISIRASYAFYREHLGAETFDMTFVDSRAMVSSGQEHAQNRQASNSYLGAQPPDWRPMFPRADAIEPSTDPKRSMERLRQAKAAIKALPVADLEQASRDFQQADSERLKCVGAERFFATFPEGQLPKAFKLRLRSPAGVSTIKADAQTKESLAADQLDAAFEEGRIRLMSALQILHAKGAEKHIKDATRLRSRSKHLFEVLVALRETFAFITSVRENLEGALIVATGMEKSSTEKQTHRALKSISTPILFQLDMARRELGKVRYPFENAGGSITLAERLIDHTPREGEWQDILEVAARAVERYPQECTNTLAELCQIARSVEKSLTKPAAESSTEPRT
jgi:Zn-dependent protease with chaperone function